MGSEIRYTLYRSFCVNFPYLESLKPFNSEKSSVFLQVEQEYGTLY